MVLFASIAMFIQLVIYSIPSIYAYYYFNPMSYYMIYCKIRMYIVLTSALIYHWSYVAASFDRYALSSTNVGLRQLAKVKIAIRVLIGICLVSMIFSAYVPVVYEIKSSTCSIFNNLSATLFTTLSNIFLNAFIPITIMIIFTLLIRKNLKEKRQRRQNLFNRDDNNLIQHKNDRQALRMLFIQVIVFILIRISWMIYSINNVISSYITNKSSDRIAIENFITAIAGALSFLFPSLSFYIYTLTSNIFREELISFMKVLFCCKCFINNHRIAPANRNRT
ncbi:hypothetical protein I4U23_015847 [Adineta vaga]|nr:hypothetical protein I4U23_015847 [Adineta vaga]